MCFQTLGSLLICSFSCQSLICSFSVVSKVNVFYCISNFWNEPYVIPFVHFFYWVVGLIKLIYRNSLHIKGINFLWYEPQIFFLQICCWLLTLYIVLSDTIKEKNLMQFNYLSFYAVCTLYHTKKSCSPQDYILKILRFLSVILFVFL